MSQRTLNFKVSEKKAVMVTGLRQFPVTFYREEWEILTNPAFVDALHKFIDANASQLATKPAKAPKAGGVSVTL